MSEPEIEGLIAQLRSFRTRAAAADALVARGRQALQPLLDALEAESQEGAKWAILKCLGEIGAVEAVPAVARRLADPDYQTVAHDALVRITGRDLGPMAADWLRWYEQKDKAPAGGAQAPAAARPSADQLDDEKLVDLALEKTGASCRREAESRYAVQVPVGAGRRREVAVVFGGKDHEGSEITVVYSMCGEARPEQYEAALRNNLRMPYGALALRESGGRLHFVMFNTILRKDLSPVELRKSIVAIAERAERVEKGL